MSGDSSKPTGPIGGPSWSESPEIDPETIPDDPLSVDSKKDDAKLGSAKKALEKALTDGAKGLGSQIQDAEQGREGYNPGNVGNDPDAGKGPRSKGREWETTGASGSSPNLGYDGDTDIDLDDLLKVYERKLKDRAQDYSHLTAYQQIRKKHEKSIQTMIEELTNYFERDEIPQLVGHFKGGVYDLRKALQSEFRRQATGKGDPKVFLKRDDPKERSVEIVFCVDISGSMGNGPGSKTDYAREAFVVFLEALGEIGIGHGAIIYNSGVSILKKVEEDKTDKEREGMLARLVGGGGNNDSAALHAAREMLEHGEAQQKVIIFLSDGAAVANHKNEVKKVEEETDIKVIGIGIGDGCQQVPDTYQHHMTVARTELLPKKLGELLMDEIMASG